MRFKGSLILFALAVILGGYYLVVERPRQQEHDDARAAEARLSDFDPEGVVALSIGRPGLDLEFVRADTRWEMTKPVRDEADDSTVMTLLSEWSDADVSRNLGPTADPARYGLDAPVALTAALASGDTVRVWLGAYTVDRSRVYATRSRGGDVLLAPTGLRRYSGVDVEDFRNKRVVAFDTSVIDSFDVVASGRAMRWTHDGTAWHTRRDGRSIVGDPVAIDVLLRTVRAMRARRFPPASETAGLFAPPGKAVESPMTADYVRIYKKPPHPWQLVSLVPGDGVALARLVEYLPGAGVPVVVDTPGAGRVVEVDSTVMDVFSTTIAELREKHLLHFDRARVARIAVTSPDTIATLVRTDNAWTTPNPGLGAMNPTRVRALLDAMAALEARRVVDGAGAGAGAGDGAEAVAALLGGAPTFTFSLFDEGGTLIDEMSSRPSRDRAAALATSRSLPVVCEVATRDLEDVIDAVRNINR